MSATGIPISWQAPELRIMGATTSRSGPLRRSACTGPMVVASSPTPSHALLMTPLLTHRLSMMSCRRLRSRPAYRSSSCSSRQPADDLFALRVGGDALAAGLHQRGVGGPVVVLGRVVGGEALHGTADEQGSGWAGEHTERRREAQGIPRNRRPPVRSPDTILLCLSPRVKYLALCPLRRTLKASILVDAGRSHPEVST